MRVEIRYQQWSAIDQRWTAEEVEELVDEVVSAGWQVVAIAETRTIRKAWFVYPDLPSAVDIEVWKFVPV